MNKTAEKNFIIGTIWNLAGGVLSFSYNFLLAAFLARYLGVEEYGKYSLVISAIAVMAVIPKMGMESIVIKEFARVVDKKNYIISAALVSLFGVVFAIGVQFLLNERYWKIPKSVYFFVILYLGLQVVEVCRYYLYSVYETKKYNIVKNILLLSFLLVFLVGINRRWNMEQLLLVRIVTDSFIISIPVFFVFDKKMDIRGKLELRSIRSYYSRILKTCFPLLISDIAIVFYMKIDQFMIDKMLSEHELGIYASVIKVSECWYFIPTVISVSCVSDYTKTYIKDQEKFWERYKNFFDCITSFSILVAVVMTLFSGVIVSILFGKEYGDAAPILALHCWSGLFVCQGCARGIYTSIREMTIFTFFNTVTTAIIKVTLGYLLIRHFGIIGAVYSTLISYFYQSYAVNFLNSQTRKVAVIQTKSFFGIKNAIRVLYNIIIGGSIKRKR